MISWHRFYDPATGRYITADPIGLEGGMNLFSYVGGNPVNWVDPMGLTSADVIKKYVFGKQISKAMGVSVGAAFHSPTYGAPNTKGGEFILMFFPDTCELALFRSSSSDFTPGDLPFDPSKLSSGVFFGAGAGVEYSNYSGDKTSGNAGSQYFGGKSHTANVDVVVGGGDAYYGDVNEHGGRWSGGKLDIGPGAGVSLSDWNLVLIWSKKVPECVCRELTRLMR